MRRRDLLRSAAVAGAAPFLASGAGGETGPQGPAGVHVALGRDPASTLSVGFTGAPATEAAVRYGRPGEPKTTVGASPAPVPGREAVAYSATLSGLAAAADYEYEVVLDGRTAGPFTVTTAAAAPDSVTVTAVGDHGVADPNNPGQRANTDDPVEVIDRARALDPDVQLLVGDIAYANGKPSTWELYFETFESLYASTPFMTVPGNHEAEPGTGLTQYDRRLNDLMPLSDRIGLDDLQREQRWYDFTYGDALFLGLSTTTDACGDASRGEEFVPLYDPRCEFDGLTYGEAQERYAREALQEAAEDPDVTWKVVYFHGPLWTDSPTHAPRRDLRKHWGKLFDEFDVDLVLSGDNHVYERTKPIRAREAQDDYGTAEAWEWDTRVGTTFVTNGTGGTSHYGFATPEPSEYLAHRTNRFFGVTELTVDAEAIEVRYVDTDGEARDRFRIVKDGEGRPVQIDRFRRGDAPPEPFDPTGTRSDDGSVFTGGQTNGIDLAVESADGVELRDRVPAEWEVVGGDLDRGRTGGAVQPAEGAAKWVYLAARDGAATYFVEAPSGPEATGSYDFGPFQARPARGRTGWIEVSGTGETYRVVGLDQNILEV